jgi:hypothetical protein
MPLTTPLARSSPRPACLRHRTVSITLDTYPHSLPALQEEAAVAGPAMEALDVGAMTSD